MSHSLCDTRRKLSFVFHLSGEQWRGFTVAVKLMAVRGSPNRSLFTKFFNCISLKFDAFLSAFG
jgi:hypothetical protein